MAALKRRARKILPILERLYPDARVMLDFKTPLQLVVATILAAQCTDERVNQVTPILFRRYRTAKDFAGADPAELEGMIRSTGFFRSKARSVIGCCRHLVAHHGGEVPCSMEELTALPGVGRKTANVVLWNAFGIPGIAVDTHLGRVAGRIGLAASDDPDVIEAQVSELFPRERWGIVTHLIGFHGRRTCFARKPNCPGCAIRDLCDWPQKPPAGARPPRGEKRRPPLTATPPPAPQRGGASEGVQSGAPTAAGAAGGTASSRSSAQSVPWQFAKGEPGTLSAGR